MWCQVWFSTPINYAPSSSSRYSLCVHFCLGLRTPPPASNCLIIVLSHWPLELYIDVKYNWESTGSILQSMISLVFQPVSYQRFQESDSSSIDPLAGNRRRSCASHLSKFIVMYRSFLDRHFDWCGQLSNFPAVWVIRVCEDIISFIALRRRASLVQFRL